MTSRFPAMLGIINTTVKTGNFSCEVPANRLCIHTLRILRNKGFIQGFHFVSPGQRSRRLHPRVKIIFKYTDSKTPILRATRVFKNSRSNFFLLKKNKLYQSLAQNKLYLLSSPNGLSLSTYDNLYARNYKTNKINASGKMLAEFFV